MTQLTTDVTFAEASAVERQPDGTWRGTLDERWTSLIAIHGGYTVAVAVRALIAELADTGQQLRTVSAQFLRSPKVGPVDITVDIARQGRSISFATARIDQPRGTAILVQATFAKPTPDAAPYDVHRAPRRPVPRPAELPRFTGGGLVHHFAQVDLTLDPDGVPFTESPEAWIGGWLRPLHPEPIDPAWLVMAGDVLPPATFARGTGPTRAASLDYTIHLAVADPAAHLPLGSDVSIETQTELAADGMAVEDGVMWAPDGTVLAVMRQTRLVDEVVPRSMAALAANA